MRQGKAQPGSQAVVTGGHGAYLRVRPRGPRGGGGRARGRRELRAHRRHAAPTGPGGPDHAAPTREGRAGVNTCRLGAPHWSGR
eukprot:2635149-Lingulodinium_polyedra.AAC.1